MSIRTDIGFSKEAVKGGQFKPKPREEKTPDQLQADASHATGLQWAAAQQQQPLTPNGVKKTDGTAKPSEPKLLGPSEFDIATISTSVATNETSVDAPRPLISAKSVGIDLAVVEGSFRAAYSQSKSHNMMLERFMSNVKIAGLNALMGLLGIDPKRIDDIKSEVRFAALGEIDSKLSNDWAYTKAMIDITGGTA